MVKSSHHLLQVAAALCLLLFSCKKDIVVDPAPPTQPENDALPLIINGTQSDRVDKANELVIWQSDGLVIDGVRPDDVDDRDGEADPNDDIFWLHIADVNPLSYQGALLSATHVTVQKDIAYVSYHLRGDSHLGAIESIDLSDPENPVVISQVFFDHADVNAITIQESAAIDDTRLWVALSDFKKGGVLGELKAVNGVFQEGYYEYVNLSNHISTGITSSANSIVHAGEELYVTSGKSRGGVFHLDAATLEVKKATSFPEAKYVTANGTENGVSTVTVLQAGTTSTLKTDVLGSNDFTNSVDIGEISHQATDANNRGKNTIHYEGVGSNTLYVSMAEAGLKAFNTANMTETWSAPAEMLTHGNCNGISSDESFLYAANGADGLAVFQLLEGEDPNLVFTWDLAETNASVNFVLAADDYVFVAKGQGGLKILKRPDSGDLLPLIAFNDIGTPDAFSEDLPVCGELLSNIFTSALPEQTNARTNRPEFFDNEVVHSLLLEEGADVYLTFLHEGAGYKNTLGYYYYDADNPPATVDDLTKIIVFPNASASGSGGELKPGNTMELLGSFSDNTIIGFFLIANGWQNGLTNGNGIHYSDPAFNEGREQSLIFYDEECEATIIAFEDINILEGGDKDYNDAIFMITTSPQEAINVESFLQLED